jgi:hypothetical protein
MPMPPAPRQPLLRTAKRTLLSGTRQIAGPFVAMPPGQIYILGNQKSGTSAIAGLLGRMAALTTTIDLYREVLKPTYHKVLWGQLAFDAFVRRNRWDMSREVVKEPNLTLLHDFLRLRFPQARTIFVVRDPRHNIRSILNRLDLPGDAADLDASAFERMAPGWRLVVAGQDLRLGPGSYIEHLALRWRAMVRIYQQHAEEMVLLRYEDFLKDKEAALEHTLRRVGRAPVSSVRDRLDVQFQPAGDHSTTPHQFFGARNLETIESLCAAEMRSLGYAAGSR